MGTNYYARTERQCTSCEDVHMCQEGTHIGKSSAGWQFLFAYNDGLYYEDKAGLESWLKDKRIFNEYGTEISHEEFWSMVEEKQATTNPSNGHFITIDGYRFMDGEFS